MTEKYSDWKELAPFGNDGKIFGHGFQRILSFPDGQIIRYTNNENFVPPKPKSSSSTAPGKPAETNPEVSV